MAKIIKNKFKNSLPFFLILCLLSLSVSGLVFNFDISIEKVGNKLGLSVELPEVEAQVTDVATTTVTVRNAAPYFTVNPAESPASASTTPTNIGDSLTFTGTGDDAEGNDYYLLVCDSDGATPGVAGAAPSCDNVQFCVSGATTASNPASCSYTVQAWAPETRAWVAYVCDNHGTEAACAATSNSGSGDSGTPFHLNHAPSFSSISTTDDLNEPGQDFTVEAVVTDGDVIGGADVLTLDVCTTNSWATSTGCADSTICTATSTSANVSCTWTSPIPLQDDTAISYYGFVMDDNDMAASGNSQTSTYTAANATPSVSSVLLNNGTAITLNIKGAADKTVYASSTTITDNNGCGDIDSATGTIFWEDAVGGADCSADDNDCYQIASGSCTVSGCTGGNDIDVVVQCTTDLVFYAKPTSGDGTDANGAWDTAWFASIRAFDEAASYASTSPGVDVNTSSAIEVTEPEIAYGSLIANTDSGSDNATTTVVNAGNSPLDTNLIGDDMLRELVGPEYIPASNQEFLLSNFTYGGGTNIASSSQTLADTVIPRPTSVTNVEDEIYWGIAVPIILSGDYYGLNTFSAALDDNVAGEW
ncbi:hypothetical protein C0584_03245 [Candidatus Parcubacteria bacterium]|nr:MAG: hypothetical protein C0584_03245 [Candidatus Parcubacteria bacterium]